MGLHAASRRARKPGLRPRTVHHPAHPNRARHRARSAPGQDDALEDFFSGRTGVPSPPRTSSAWRRSLAGASYATWSCSSSTSRHDAFTSPVSRAGPTANGWPRSHATSPTPLPAQDTRPSQRGAPYSGISGGAGDASSRGRRPRPLRRIPSARSRPSQQPCIRRR